MGNEVPHGHCATTPRIVFPDDFAGDFAGAAEPRGMTTETRRDLFFRSKSTVKSSGFPHSGQGVRRSLVMGSAETRAPQSQENSLGVGPTPSSIPIVYSTFPAAEWDSRSPSPGEVYLFIPRRAGGAQVGEADMVFQVRCVCCNEAPVDR